MRLCARARAHACVRARGEGERILSRGSLSSVASWTHLHMIPHMFRLASHALAEANASHGSDLALRLRLEESHYSLVITRSLTHRAPYFTLAAASFSAKISISTIDDRTAQFFIFFSPKFDIFFSRCAKKLGDATRCIVFAGGDSKNGKAPLASAGKSASVIAGITAPVCHVRNGVIRRYQIDVALVRWCDRALDTPRKRNSTSFKGDSR